MIICLYLITQMNLCVDYKSQWGKNPIFEYLLHGIHNSRGRAMAQVVSRRLLTAMPGQSM